MKRPMWKLAKDALDVQDACNPVAVCKGFDRVMMELWQEHKIGGWDELRAHPVCILWANKLADLFGEASVGSDGYAKAYWACKDMQPTPAQRQQRQNIRNFLLTASADELMRDLESRTDPWSKACVQEMIDELEAENAQAAS